MVPEFQPPDWCTLKYNGVADAIIGAAKEADVKLCTSSSLTFDLNEWDVVSRCFEKFGKPVMTKKFVELCRETLGVAGWKDVGS